MDDDTSYCCKAMDDARAEIARLREALKRFADHNNWDERTMSWITQRDLPWEIAYAALVKRGNFEA